MSIIFSRCKKLRSFAKDVTLLREIRLNLSPRHSRSNCHMVITPVTDAAKGQPPLLHTFESTPEGVKMTPPVTCTIFVNIVNYVIETIGCDGRFSRVPMVMTNSQARSKPTRLTLV